MRLLKKLNGTKSNTEYIWPANLKNVLHTSGENAVTEISLDGMAREVVGVLEDDNVVLEIDAVDREEDELPSHQEQLERLWVVRFVLQYYSGLNE